MARYIIGTKLTLKGEPTKAQPADKFRKLLIRQKIPFIEKILDPINDRIDLLLKNERWDRLRETNYFHGNLINKILPTYRQLSVIDKYKAYEFIFDDTQTL